MIELNLEFIRFNQINVLSNTKVKIHEGDLFILGGNNGSGKSTLIYILSGLIPHYIPASISAHLSVNGIKINKDFALHSTYVKFQNPEDNFMALNVDDVINEARIKTISGNFKKIYSFIKDLEPEQRISRLSTGQKQRLSIFQALTSSREYIFLDEPFAFLDSEASTGLSDILSGRLFEKTIILADHRYSAVLKNTTNESITLNSNIQVQSQKFVPPPFVSRFDNNHSLTFNNLIWNDRLSHVFLEGSHTLPPGRIIGLIGKNGCGKSTVCRILSGIQKGSSGKIFYGGKKVQRSELRKLVKMSFQNPDVQFFLNQIEMELDYVLKKNGYSSEVRRYKLGYIERVTGIKLKQSPWNLSYGQRKIISILLTFALDPRIIILDEPFSGLDEDFRGLTYNLINFYRETGCGIILTGHDEYDFMKLETIRVAM